MPKTAMEILALEDGMVTAAIEHGDGSLPPFLHIDVTNVDEPPLPNAVTVALTREEVRQLGAWLTDIAGRDDAWNRP